MKKANALVAVLVACGAVFSSTAIAQITVGGIKGQVLQSSQPVANVQVVFTDMQNGKQYKTKTEKNGNFVSLGMRVSSYRLEIIGSNKEVLYTKENVTVEGYDTVLLAGSPIDLGNPAASGGIAGGAGSSGSGGKKKGKEDAAKANADNAAIASMNELIKQAQAAMQQQDWPGAEKALSQLIAADPNTTRWEFYKALADSEKNEGKLDEALRDYDKGIQVAQSVAAGTAARDPRNPNPDPAKAKAGVGAMLSAEGSIYVQTNKTDQAIEAYRKSAEVDPTPATAYYNLCALAYNAGKYEAAADACDKSTAADPNKAEAWFFKGAALNKMNNPSASEALNKYLQLEPAGTHSAQAKQLIGQK